LCFHLLNFNLDNIIIMNINNDSPMLLNIPIVMNMAVINSIKQIFSVVLFHFTCYTPTILNFVLSGNNPPCILNVLSSV